jgi:hypothetical protein
MSDDKSEVDDPVVPALSALVRKVCCEEGDTVSMTVKGKLRLFRVGAVVDAAGIRCLRLEPVDSANTK